MGNQRILIVDDEEAILTVLSNSLKKRNADCEIVTATNGSTALDQISRKPFDLVITDYKMNGMDGLELMEAISSIHPETRVILISAYGSDNIEAEARRLQAYKFLAKPLEINDFRQVVEEALGDIAISRPGILILSDERYRQAIHLLGELRGDVGALCILLATGDGHIIAREGNPSDHPLEQISSLLGGGIATLLEAGRLLDKDTESINLVYREGKRECMYAINIGEQLLLILILHNGPYTSRIGSVWYYAQQAAIELQRTLGEAEFASPTQIFDEKLVDNLDKEIDHLFLEQQLSNGNPGEDSAATLGRDSNIEPSEAMPSVMTYSEAVESGLIKDDLT